MAKKPTKKINLRKHRNIIIAGSVLVVLLLGGVVFALHNSSSDPSNTPALAEEDQPKINLRPPTEAEKNESNSHKTDLPDGNSEADKPATPEASTKHVTTVITSASKNEVRAYVSGVIEDDGTCTVKATQGSTVVTATSSGVANVSNTICTPLSFSPALGDGKWIVTLTYSSASATGDSTQTWELN